MTRNSQKMQGVAYLFAIMLVLISTVDIKFSQAREDLNLQTIRSETPIAYVVEKQLDATALSAFLQDQSKHTGTQYFDIKVGADELNLRHYNLDSGEMLNEFENKVYSDWAATQIKSFAVGEELTFVRSGDDNFMLNKETGKIILCPFLGEDSPASVAKAVPVGSLVNPRFFVFMFQPTTSMLRIYPFASRAEAIEGRDFGRDVVTRYAQINFLERIKGTSDNSEYFRRAQAFFKGVGSFKVFEDQEDPQSAFNLTFRSMRRDVKVSVLADWARSVIYADVNFGMTEDVFRDYREDRRDVQQERYYPQGDYRLTGNEHQGTVEIKQTGFRFGFAKQ
jgi:hypothetical protein